MRAADAKELDALGDCRDGARLCGADTGEDTGLEDVLLTCDLQLRPAAQGRVDLLQVVRDRRVQVVVLEVLSLHICGE